MTTFGVRRTYTVQQLIHALSADHVDPNATVNVLGEEGDETDDIVVTVTRGDVRIEARS